MPNGVDEGVIAYSVYEDEKMFYGVAEVDLPDFENEVFNVSGAGISQGTAIVIIRTYPDTCGSPPLCPCRCGRCNGNSAGHTRRCTLGSA